MEIKEIISFRDKRVAQTQKASRCVKRRVNGKLWFWRCQTGPHALLETLALAISLQTKLIIILIQLIYVCNEYRLSFDAVQTACKVHQQMLDAMRASAVLESGGSVNWSKRILDSQSASQHHLVWPW